MPLLREQRAGQQLAAPHVWFNDSRDIFLSNYVFTPYRAIDLRVWGQQVDYNFLRQPGVRGATPAAILQEQSSQDAHSLTGDAPFVDAAAGYCLMNPSSPALVLGFANFG